MQTRSVNGHGAFLRIHHTDHKTVQTEYARLHTTYGSSWIWCDDRAIGLEINKGHWRTHGLLELTKRFKEWMFWSTRHHKLEITTLTLYSTDSQRHSVICRSVCARLVGCARFKNKNWIWLCNLPLRAACVQNGNLTRLSHLSVSYDDTYECSHG